MPAACPSRASCTDAPPADNTLEFVVDGNMAFSVPYADISQSVKQGKRDISIELHQDDTARPEVPQPNPKP